MPVKSQYIKDLESQMEINDIFLIGAVNKGRTSRGSSFLSLELQDKTGKIQAKVWEQADQMIDILKEGSVCQIIGRIDDYKGINQVIIHQADMIQTNSIDWSNFLKSSIYNSEAMMNDLLKIINSFKDKDYRNLLKKIIKHPDVYQKFSSMPAAKNFHHAYLSGLLEHTLSISRLAIKIADHYGSLINRDLLISGAILHDIGKIWELTSPPNVDYTTEGRLLGHLVIGSQFVGSIAEQIANFPTEKLNLLQHLILSHHGEYMYGSPRLPNILEAIILHQIDDMDAKLNGISEFIEQQVKDESGWTSHHRLLNNFFYKPPQFLNKNMDDSKTKNNDLLHDNTEQIENRLF